MDKYGLKHYDTKIWGVDFQLIALLGDVAVILNV